MLEQLKNITIWQSVLAVVGIIAFLAVFIKNWETVKPKVKQLTSCFKRSKANQALLFEHEEKLKEVQQDVKTIKKNLNELTADSREYRKTSLSDKIFKKYHKYKVNGCISRDEIENFNICIDRYRKCLLAEDIETDIVLNKYLTEVMNLDVKGE